MLGGQTAPSRVKILGIGSSRLLSRGGNNGLQLLNPSFPDIRLGNAPGSAAAGESRKNFHSPQNARGFCQDIVLQVQLKAHPPLGVLVPNTRGFLQLKERIVKLLKEDTNKSEICNTSQLTIASSDRRRISEHDTSASLSQRNKY